MALSEHKSGVRVRARVKVRVGVRVRVSVGVGVTVRVRARVRVIVMVMAYDLWSMGVLIYDRVMDHVAQECLIKGGP